MGLEKQAKYIIKSILTYALVAFLTGMVMGWIRYWVGYYVLLQGIIAGLFIPWIIHKLPGGSLKILYDKSFQLSILLFLLFMTGQATGFGLAQPWFDPTGWLTRILNGKTTESVFGIFSTGGVVHQYYSNGLHGGFWALLTIFDMVFMFFFLLISLPPKSVKKKS